VKIYNYYFNFIITLFFSSVNLIFFSYHGITKLYKIISNIYRDSNMDIVEIKRKYVLTVLKGTCYSNMDIVEIKRDMY